MWVSMRSLWNIECLCEYLISMNDTYIMFIMLNLPVESAEIHEEHHMKTKYSLYWTTLKDTDFTTQFSTN